MSKLKSGRPGRLSGLAAFRARYPKAKALVLGGEWVPLEDFFQRPPTDWFR